MLTRKVVLIQLLIENNINLSLINGRELNSYIDVSKNLSISYKYDIDGIRTEKIVNGIKTEYYIENSTIIFWKDRRCVLYYLYENDNLIGLKYNNLKYFFIKNIQNDIIGLMDE